MKLNPPCQAIINSLKAGRQPAKKTPKWAMEALEEGLLIEWICSSQGYKLNKDKLDEFLSL
jgi:hypothetical protein